MDPDFEDAVAVIQRIHAVPKILDVICHTTGMGFSAVARVTDKKWTACQVLDKVGFGLVPGAELPLATTICDEIRQHQRMVVIENVAEDPIYRDHHTPKLYGLQSYISVPIQLKDGRLFGTLCAIDAKPNKITSSTIETFKLFADLIAYYLGADEQWNVTAEALNEERRNSELREQFIAILGHDLRNPLAAVDAGVNKLLRDGWNSKSENMLKLMKASIFRMSGLIANTLDFARGRLGSGIPLQLDASRSVSETLRLVSEELIANHPQRVIVQQLDFDDPLDVDHARLGQLYSNLLGNALTHGAVDQAVTVATKRIGSQFELSVTNSGAPIPDAIMKHLFKPFSRGADKLHSEGLGLGLYIASEIAKAHGGTIDVQSNEERTTFAFRMPIAGEAL